MNYRIIVTPNFEREAKKLLKKYTSLAGELNDLEIKLSKGNSQGTPIGSNAYKIRLAVRSKGKGKSGGLRVITFMELDFVILDLTNIYLISVYDKSVTESISKVELKRLIAIQNL